LVSQGDDESDDNKYLVNNNPPILGEVLVIRATLLPNLHHYKNQETD
jgi:hypothetical protein